jgi:hypothetical protein
MVIKPKGLISVKEVHLADGTRISNQQAVDYGWIVPDSKPARGWGLGREEISLGQNLFLDNGRQMLAYCFGFRSPIDNYVLTKFGVGTGFTAPKVTDVSLEAPIAFSVGVYTKDIAGIDYPTAFVMRVEFVLGATEANGYLITEMGLYTGDETLVCRRTNLGINKSSDFVPTLTWRIRM